MKNVVLLISGRADGENALDVEVPPGASAGDVLAAAGLENYLLSKEGSSQHFAAEEQIYDQIEDGSKLRATPIATAGKVHV